MPRVFDDKELLERIDHDWEFLTETVEMLSRDGRARLAEVDRALGAADAAAVAGAAHALKGMISNFCSPVTQAAALEVEQIAKSADLSGASKAVKVLQNQLETLIAELTEFVATRA